MMTAVVLAVLVAAAADATDQLQPPEPAAPGTRTPAAEITPEVDRLVVLVLPLTAQRVSPDLVATIDELLATELSGWPGFDVVTLADLDALLEAEKLKDLLGCDDISCAAEIGGAAGADRILTGSVGRLDTNFVVTLRWLDAVYSEPLGRSSQQSESGELALRAATQRALRDLLGSSAEEDDMTRRRKRTPTFWTSEISVGAGLHNGPEIYDVGPVGELRLAWGGRTSRSDTSYYVVGGLTFKRFSGKRTGPTGTIRFSRSYWGPNLSLRAAVPLTASKRTRVFGEVGLGLAIDLHEAKQVDGVAVQGTHSIFEIRFGAGLWHRFSHDHSLFALYRLQMLLPGTGADGISELVELGSTKSLLLINEVQVGWALHF